MTGYAKVLGVSLAAGLAGAASALPTTIYDSGGFEQPTFSVGTLPGQDGWVQLSVAPGGNSTADVHDATSGNPIKAGDQAVTVFRDGNDSSGSTLFNVPLTANHDRFVFVDWDMYVPIAPDIDPDPNQESFGPGFSMEAYVDGAGGGLKRVAAVGIDAADGAFYELLSNFPSVPNYTGVGLLLDDWQSWQLILDFVDEVYFLSVDGTVLTPGGAPMLENIDYAGGDRLTDASIVPFATDTQYFTVEGDAFIDNYRIRTDIVIPEPASFGVLAFGLLGLTTRRRLLGC